MRLKQATVAVPFFESIPQFSVLKDALEHMSTAESCDVIFISERYPESEVEAFVTEAKKTLNGSVASFILVLGTSHQDSPTVAKNVMRGIDGFLFEPYSVNYLMEITQLASKIKSERHEAREKLAVTLLVHDIITQLDLCAFLKSIETDPGRSMKELYRLSASLQKLSAESKEMYYDARLSFV